MKLSVVMAVRNGDPFLRAAIESVLSQSFTDFEFLIVDDASTDSTPATLSEFAKRDARVVVLRNETNLGPYPSLNRALLEARGVAIARQDADDLSTADRFAIQLQALESEPDVSLVIGAFDVFQSDEGGAKIVSRPSAWQPRIEWELLFTNAVGAGAQVMFPRTVQGTRVRYPAKRRYAEDYALWCELVRRGRVVCPAPVIYRYRQHPESITNRSREQQAQCLSETRHEYQALYLGSDVQIEAVSELARFWLLEGRLEPGGVARIAPSFSRLRDGFLSYVERRFGQAARDSLAADVDRDLVGRLGYWLARSVRFHDSGAVRDLLTMAGPPRRIMGASGKALGYAAGAAFRRLAR